jgi:RNA polymerase sigma-70 factor (ECF subfamily)
MGKVEDYRAQLKKLGAWGAFLLQESRLLGPRANLGLAYAVSPLFWPPSLVYSTMGSAKTSADPGNQHSKPNMQQLEDLALIDLISQRNEAALGELYDRYQRLIYSIALNIAGRSEDAEEITLDVFIRVWEKAHTYRPERAKVSTWLTRMARNKAIDVLRREEVRPMKHSVSWAKVSPEPAADSDRPEAAAHLAMQQERVRQAIATLPDAQQKVLALAYFKGYSHSEIAHELDIPLGTAKARIRSGMMKLRAVLHDE